MQEKYCGLTGCVTFDEKGERESPTIYISELEENGFEHVSWAIQADVDNDIVFLKTFALKKVQKMSKRMILNKELDKKKILHVSSHDF